MNVIVGFWKKMFRIVCECVVECGNQQSLGGGGTIMAVKLSGEKGGYEGMEGNGMEECIN